MIEDTVANLEREMESFRIDRLNSPTSVANLFSSGHMNLENVLMKIETLISGLLDDMGRQGKELSSWKDKFREMYVLHYVFFFVLYIVTSQFNTHYMSSLPSFFIFLLHSVYAIPNTIYAIQWFGNSIGRR